MKPFLKWAGSKYKIIEKIKASLPQGKRLIEPFAGSGSVFLNTHYESYLVADTNADLINLFCCLQVEGSAFVDDAQLLFIPKNNQEDMYYQLREEFNTITDVRRKSALFIYLNRHCFNGLCRYNAKGGFNVPFGRYAKPKLPKSEMLYFIEKSKKAIFKVADFSQTMLEAQQGDVVYCDPPYAPLTTTANFSSYTKDGFGLLAQQKLADLAHELTQKGIPVIISNHDTDFTRTMYAQAQIQSFDVQRFIAANAASRHKASELLAVF